ncbi:helix-turn-helix domain-containing protein [Gluconobacter oxydans]|uniref:TetR/AcrR family transcriptional regulator n=1 Tax=Gluconobacter oxydans TaxID=442 RepID=UPI0039EA35DA
MFAKQFETHDRISNTRIDCARNEASLKHLAASRLFRERGIDGVGVADIAKAAGLTHGALYAHFKSKEELAAAAFAHGFATNMAGARAWVEANKPKFSDLLTAFLSASMRDRVETGCPMTASASEIGRHGCEISTCFTRAFREQLELIEASLDDGMPAVQKRRLALATVAAQIGAVAVSRAIKKADHALANEVLEAMRTTLENAYLYDDTAAPQAGRADKKPPPHRLPDVPSR